jgi:ABC-type antimicrobial peptide transport system permease subunit
VLFSLSYAAAELRRRWSRALVTALGLAAGVSLVVAISGITAGFHQAGEKALAPLGDVGTDILVTQTASDASKAAKAAAGGNADAGTDAAAQSLIAANRSVVTNLAALGRPGSRFTKDFFLLAELLPVPQSTAARLAALPHVQSATGALTVLASHQTGVVPKVVASLTTGGQTVTQLHRPSPLTRSEAAAMRSCVLSDSGLSDIAGLATSSATGKAGPAVPSQIEKCLPMRFREYVQQVDVPLQTVKQVMNPPQTDIKATPYTAAGVDTASPESGLVHPDQVVAGRYLGAAARDEVLADAAYAASAHLRVGSVLPINGRTLRVVGLVNAGVGGQSANLYFPLPTLQELTGQHARVNLVLVRARSAADVPAVTKEIRAALPGVHVVTAAELADQVKGSLATARSITTRFGRALALVAFGAALLITILLTLGSVAKRVREIGTLRAVGWSRRRMVGQLTMETFGIGVAGAAGGMLLGIVAASGLARLAPDFAIHGPRSKASSLAKIVGSTHSEGSPVMHIHLTAPVGAQALVTGALLALVGSLVAGVLAGWRAASLTPAVALRDLG